MAKSSRGRPAAKSLCALALSSLLLGGCVKRSPVIGLEIRTLQPQVHVTSSTGARLALPVVPLRDSRPEGTVLGTRTIWGLREIHFDLEGGELGDIVAQVFIDSLKHRRGWQTWLAKPGVTSPPGTPHLTLTGDVLECFVDARSWGVLTILSIRTKLLLQAGSAASEKPISMAVHREMSDWTFGFDHHAAEMLLNAAFSESLWEFVDRARLAERVRDGT